MGALKVLWADESGLILSAEAVAIGALGVVGAAVGAGAVARSVNSELEEAAFALRSLDQSYSIPGHRIGNAFVAGSSYTQKPVKEAHRELREQIERDHKAEEKRLEKAREEEKRSETPQKRKKRKQAQERENDELTPVLYAPSSAAETPN